MLLILPLFLICLQNSRINNNNFIEHCTKHVDPNHQAMLTAETYSTTNFIDVPQILPTTIRDLCAKRGHKDTHTRVGGCDLARLENRFPLYSDKGISSTKVTEHLFSFFTAAPSSQWVSKGKLPRQTASQRRDKHYYDIVDESMDATHPIGFRFEEKRLGAKFDWDGVIKFRRHTSGLSRS